MIVAFSVTPIGTADASVSAQVAKAVRVVRESGLPHRTDPMFTSLEGEWDEVMDVVRRAVLAVAEDAERVSLVLKADYRPAVEGAMEHKVQVIEERLAADEAARQR